MAGSGTAYEKKLNDFLKKNCINVEAVTAGSAYNRPDIILNKRIYREDKVKKVKTLTKIDKIGVEVKEKVEYVSYGERVVDFCMLPSGHLKIEVKPLQYKDKEGLTPEQKKRIENVSLYTNLYDRAKITITSKFLGEKNNIPYIVNNLHEMDDVPYPKVEIGGEIFSHYARIIKAKDLIYQIKNKCLAYIGRSAHYRAGYSGAFFDKNFIEDVPDKIKHTRMPTYCVFDNPPECNAVVEKYYNNKDCLYFNFGDMGLYKIGNLRGKTNIDDKIPNVSSILNSGLYLKYRYPEQADLNDVNTKEKKSMIKACKTIHGHLYAVCEKLKDRLEASLITELNDYFGNESNSIATSDVLIYNRYKEYIKKEFKNFDSVKEQNKYILSNTAENMIKTYFTNKFRTYNSPLDFKNRFIVEFDHYKNINRLYENLKKVPIMFINDISDKSTKKFLLKKFTEEMLYTKEVIEDLYEKVDINNYWSIQNIKVSFKLTIQYTPTEKTFNRSPYSLGNYLKNNTIDINDADTKSTICKFIKSGYKNPEIKCAPEHVACIIDPDDNEYTYNVDENVIEIKEVGKNVLSEVTTTEKRDRKRK